MKHELAAVIAELDAIPVDRYHARPFGQHIALVHGVHVDQRVAIGRTRRVDMQVQPQIGQIRAYF